MGIIAKKEIFGWWRAVKEKGADELILCNKCANHDKDNPMVTGDIFTGNIDDIYICDECHSRIETKSYLKKYGEPVE